MPTELNWLEGPWRGKVALGPRPRGGDWLEDDIAAWKRHGVNAVLSLLTPEEERDLDLLEEARRTRSAALTYFSFPIADRQVPLSQSELTDVIEKVDDALTSGKNVMIHCRQGIGRSGLVAACLLVSKGLTPESAVGKVTVARGVPVPETREQRDWIDHYAAVLAGSK